MLTLTSSMANAEYTLHYPMEASRGGFLPDRSIQFVAPSNEIWIDVEPSYTEWSYNDDYYDCNSYLPSQEKYSKEETFSQEVSGCSRNLVRYKQERQQNQETLAYKNIGSPILENDTETNLNYSRNINGLDERFVLSYGAGRVYYKNSTTIVGAYARTDTNLDIGSKVLTEQGYRMLAYFYKIGTYNSGGTCEFRLGATSPDGWTPNVVPAGINDYFDKYKYVTLYNSNGTVYKKHTLPSGPSTNRDGAYKSLVVPCTDLSRFYTNLNIYSKVVFSMY